MFTSSYRVNWLVLGELRCLGHHIALSEHYQNVAVGKGCVGVSER